MCVHDRHQKNTKVLAITGFQPVGSFGQLKIVDKVRLEFNISVDPQPCFSYAHPGQWGFIFKVNYRARDKKHDHKKMLHVNNNTQFVKAGQC